MLAGPRRFGFVDEFANMFIGNGVAGVHKARDFIVNGAAGIHIEDQKPGTPSSAAEWEAGS